MSNYKLHFETLTDAVRVEVSPANRGDYHNCETDEIVKSQHRNRSSWLGFSTGNQALKAIHNGWPEGVVKTQEAFSKLPQISGIQSIKRRRVRRDFGDSVDMQAIYSGNVDRAWTTTERSMCNVPGGSHVTLLVDVGANCSVEADAFFWRGAMALAIADGLERTGRRVKIVAMQTTRGSHDGCTGLHTNTVDVKQFSEPLDLNRLATILCTPAFFRIYMFRMIMAQPDKADWSLGSHHKIDNGYYEYADMPEEIKHVVPDGHNAMVVSDAFNEHDANEQMKALLEKLKS